MGEHSPEFDLEKLKREMNLTDAAIRASGFSCDDLQEIYTDYLSRLVTLEQIKNAFVSKYIVAAEGIRFHSYSGRVKAPYHLIEKIIRKRNTNDAKYRDMTVSDYYKYITDLIGCRILLVYKEDWEPVHNYLTKLFPCGHYIDEDHYASSYDKPSVQPPFMAEPPVVHMRLGDPEIYPQSKITVKRDRYYRSLHYIIRHDVYYIEIQVRTLFEEAWGEVDHDVLYPYYKDDPVLVKFSKLINRAAGMSDEMSTYFKNELPIGRPHREGPPLDVPDSVPRVTGGPSHFAHPDDAQRFEPAGSTTKDVLDSIIHDMGGNMRS